MSTYTLSEKDFIEIFQNTLSNLYPFQKTWEAFESFCEKNNLNGDFKINYFNKKYTYLELYNYVYYRRHSILN